MPDGNAPMTFHIDIYPDGKTMTEVVERGGQDCSNILKVAEKLGDIESDERTGPDCDRQEETQI